MKKLFEEIEYLLEENNVAKINSIEELKQAIINVKTYKQFTLFLLTTDNYQYKFTNGAGNSYFYTIKNPQGKIIDSKEVNSNEILNMYRHTIQIKYGTWELRIVY